jgi:cation:H+ antiporter
MLELAIQSITLVVSLVVLAGASHFAIKYIEDLIELTGLSEASVGFAVLSVMTSVPEITVAIFSILQGTPGISVGDIMGSNVFNIGVVVGIMAAGGFLKKCSTNLLTELVDILVLSSLIPLLLVIFKIASPLVGVLLLLIFAFSIYRMTKKRNAATSNNRKTTIQNKSNTIMVIAKIVIGIGAVIFAARFVVTSASNIAILAGMPPIAIGAKIIAIGTSLPELTLDLTAARRGRVNLAIGDAVGSNLTNITLVLGIVLLFSSFTVDITVFTEIIPFVLVTTILLWRFLTKGGVSPIGGVLLILVYVLFQAML